MKITLKLPGIFLMMMLMLTSTFAVAGPDGQCTGPWVVVAQSDVLSHDGKLKLNAKVVQFELNCLAPPRTVHQLLVNVTRADGVFEILFFESQYIAYDDQGNIVQTDDGSIAISDYQTYEDNDISSVEVLVQGFDTLKLTF
ncbi:MAG: hypothetical protein A2381_08045 [Bdellovibrionales bacterium RIFOXYB1_FULL_37_110]|nr:MAG: hypothetical protein A2181_04810 [Bdellovibrionales bacterium RIFOXYA1_FULL_38_20]OFZ52555.1 MAG: hypothetical protein A2417_00765 [Bdellovibrionales bacterium RIFOXYC1_FULL_37_79]OFZ59757.1 MAG: hypothetical protein A2381_08045 [Bdellovibrionales bacterium RIFOXYB1_FULL_37_110]OFZ65336.1 MAG: hypothetical protein A2577_04285 [Bdellovibrionales bacterium RIFOXYD1_FULL_36_51]